MTIAEAYKAGLKLLNDCNIDDAMFECSCLFEHCFGYDKIKRVTHSDDTADGQAFSSFLSCIKRRTDGEPLQYILGKWQFYGFDFFVGEGVLIPRPETELLVQEADEYIKNSGKKCIVYDLCAGSGAIGLTLAKLHSECDIFLFEKYDEALCYLKKNKEHLNTQNAEVIAYDIFNGFCESLPKPDLIVSNPPYIAENEIKSLQSEVLREPHTALDGGKDGLDFYRCLYEKWYGTVNKDGCMLLECGDAQSEEIKSIFSSCNGQISVLYDFNNIDRAVKINV